VSEIRVVISLYSHFFLSGFLLLYSPVDVGHIDRTILKNIDQTTLKAGMLSSLSLLAYSCYLFNLYLYLPYLILEVHCYNKLVSELVLFSREFRNGFGKVQSREIQWEEYLQFVES